MSYCAVYEFDSFDLVQIGACIGSADESQSKQLLLWLESQLHRLQESSLSLRLDVKKGKINRTIRIAFKGNQAQAFELINLLERQALVEKVFTDRVGFDEQFAQEFTHMAMVPNQVYIAGKVELVTDYVLLTNLEEIVTSLTMSQVDFCYQLNFGLMTDSNEVNRFIRKSIVQLEESPGIPAKLVQQQRRFAARAQKAHWIGEEYFACSTEQGIQYIGDLVEEYFADENAKFGYPNVALAENDEVADQFISGLLARAFESLSIAQEASQLISTQQLSNALTLSVPSPEITEESIMPQAVSSQGKWDVFLSHSSKDHLTTKAVCHYLESQGIRCWMAPRDIPVGDLWSQAIMQGIKGSKVTVLIFSGPANESRYVLREIEQSVTLNMPILPLRIEDLPPSDSLSFFISSHHWFDAVNEQLEAKLPELKAAILPHLAVIQ